MFALQFLQPWRRGPLLCRVASRRSVSFFALADLTPEKPIGFRKFSGPFLDPGLKFRMRSCELLLRKLAVSGVAYKGIEAVRFSEPGRANRKLHRKFVPVSVHGGDLNAIVH